MVKQCTKCGVEKSLVAFGKQRSTKDGYKYQCKECAAAYDKLPKVRAYRKEYHSRDEVKAHHLEYSRRSDVKAKALVYRQSVEAQELRRLRMKVYCSTPEGKAKRSRHSRERRAREIGAEGSFTPIEWVELCRYYNNVCLRCKRGDVALAADHVIPLSRGGSNWISNIQPLCKSCNSKKGVESTDYR